MMTCIPKNTLTVPSVFHTHAEAEALVKTCEAKFDRRLDEMAAAISRDCVKNGVRMIRLSGPTCSGKTTTAMKLIRALEAEGCQVYPVSLDDFFYDREILWARAAEGPDKRLDYDSVKTMDLDTLAHCVKDLSETGRASVPVFDFEEGRRINYRMLEAKDEKPIFLFEGIQAVYPEVTAILNDMPNRSLFISVFRPITVTFPNGEKRTFDPEQIRLLRRIVRDTAKRGATPAFTLSLWHTVRENEIRSILPYAEQCDYLIDSVMAFDIHMLAPYIARHLTGFPENDPEASTARQLLDSISGIEGIPSDILAENSLYHEFIRLDS